MSALFQNFISSFGFLLGGLLGGILMSFFVKDKRSIILRATAGGAGATAISLLVLFAKHIFGA
jgi:hypothetical protein